MNRRSTRTSRGFSLVELVIVVVIIGVISAIAIPRMTRGANNAAATALTADLATLRGAIETYRAEHQGLLPTATDIVNQLTKYTKIDGTDANDAVDTAAGRVYGPYLRDIPPLPVGAKKGSTLIAAADAAGVGWIYTATGGTIVSNTTATEKDQNLKAYNTY